MEPGNRPFNADIVRVKRAGEVHQPHKQSITIRVAQDITHLLARDDHDARPAAFVIATYAQSRFPVPDVSRSHAVPLAL